MSAEPHRIDVHHHIVPREYVEALAEIGVEAPGRFPFPDWSPQASLEVMDQNGIATAITSLSAPGVYFGDDAFARDLARRCNEFSAGLVSDHRGRFGAFAVLPLPDMDAALAELEYGLDTLQLDGVALLTSIGRKYLGDPTFDPLFDELNRRRAVVYTHPNIPPGSDVPELVWPAPLIEFVFDTTRAAVNMVLSGTLERHPDIRLILSHAGGAVPYIAGRIALADDNPLVSANIPRGAIASLRRLYYDTALSATQYALPCLQKLVDPTHILFGSDYPFAPERLTAATVSGLAEYGGLDASARIAVERENAAGLFPRRVTPDVSEE
jgi:predicted TIM-barrel fold metal-dependent hydrolase